MNTKHVVHRTSCTVHEASSRRRPSPAKKQASRPSSPSGAELGRVCGSGSQAAVRLQHPLRQHDAGVKHLEQRLAGIQAPGLARCEALFQAPQRHAAPGA